MFAQRDRHPNGVNEGQRSGPWKARAEAHSRQEKRPAGRLGVRRASYSLAR